MNLGGRPLKFETAEQLEAAIEKYFDQFTKKGKRALNESRPTITGLVLFCGFESRQSFYAYEQKPGFSYTIKRARSRIENIYEQSLLTARNAAGPIFALKNLGWRDEQSISLDQDGMRAATRLLFPDELLTAEQIAMKNN